MKTTNIEAKLAIVRQMVLADRFNATITGLHAFHLGAVCILKTAKTGKGLHIAPRHFAKVNDYALNCNDLTGTIKPIYDACTVAMRSILKQLKEVEA